ncbi:MAG TPA: hypothetical protein VML75_01645 [Kofleriaceae bacterium]|nr:hypothetical protein [Kofleriaceae bacterium]
MGGSQRFRFRARYTLFAWGMIAIGALFASAPWTAGADGDSGVAALIIGIGAALLGVLYLVSPAWRIVVVIDDDALEVLSGRDRRFRLAWSEVVRVVASPGTKTCFVDGGDPSRSLKVPGKGAPAPYDIEGREALFDAIMAHVPPTSVEEVPFLEVESA